MTFYSAKNIYCIGVGGIGVSAVARYAQLLGKQVSGSDVSENTVIQTLGKEGIHVDIGEQKGADIPNDCDCIVYSSAVPVDNPQRVEADTRGIEQMSYPQVLGEISQSHTTIAIAGTHGKSTTTAMLGLVAREAGLDPLVIVGTLMRDISKFRNIDITSRGVLHTPFETEGGIMGTNVFVGKGEYFIVEACEFSGHFNTLTPDYLIITNIDADHLDYFKTQENIDAAFYAFASKTKKKIIACGDDAGCRRVLSSLGNVVWYGFGDDGETPRWGVSSEDIRRRASGASLQVPGKHNVLNALGVMTMAQTLGIDDEITKKVLESFTGTWRRFELVGLYALSPKACPESGRGIREEGVRSEGETPQRGVSTSEGIPVISDYAHHPKEIEATIQAAREKYPDKRIVAVFQPHQRNRTKMLFNEFVRTLSLADAVIVCEIYDVAGREHGEDISSQQIVDALKSLVETYSNTSLQNTNKEIWYAKDLLTAESIIQNNASSEDVLLIMGAGDIDSLARRIV